MAWIAKDSAAAKADRRAEPYLTDAMKQRLTAQTLPRYETTRAALLPVLHTIQHEYGWIPSQAMIEIADFLKVKPAEVLDTASFYEEYWLKPKGKHLIAVCRSVACEFCGQPKVSDAIKQHLGIDIGETTDDGRFTIVEVECLGSCGTAPAALIDETLHENLTPESAVKAVQATTDNGHH
jgi:NADH-quinone oxidoreductase subunit E